MRLRNGLAAVIALLALASPAAASFPGTNGPIVFQSSSSIFKVIPGDEPKVAIRSNLASDPAVSPDGTQIAYQYGHDLRVAKIDGSDTHTVTRGAHNDTSPAWSPDGRRIVFVRGDELDLFIVGVNGKGLTKLTTNGGAFVERVPDWSPDGSAIAFDRRPCDENGGKVCIWKIAPAGTAAVNLTPEDAPPDCPNAGRRVGPRGNSSHASWSPDGKRLVFEGSPFHCQDGLPIAGVDIWAMNADGSEKVDLTPDANDETYDEQPSWSPDGAKIAFQSDRLHGGGRDVKDILTMPAGGLKLEAAFRVYESASRADLKPKWAAGVRRSALPPVKLLGDSGDDALNGTPLRDVMKGFGGDDSIDGLGSNDLLYGGPGNDRLTGSEGNDELYGEPGNDRLAGTSGNDKLAGGRGDDTLIGGSGTNTYFGGPGDDNINSVNSRREIVHCGPGKDTLTADAFDTARGCERVKLPG